MKILIIQTAFLGDVVLATPLIEKLKARFQDCELDLMVRKGNEGVLKDHPKLRRVLTFDKKQKYNELFRLIRELRKQRYDYVINVQRFFSSGLLTVLSGGKVKIGFDKNPLSFFYSIRRPHHISTESPVHEVERNISLLEGLTDLELCRPKLYPSSQEEQAVPRNYEYVCIAPTSRWFTKQFPLEKWCELIKKLPTTYRVHLIGGPDDVEICEQIRAATDLDRVVVSAGKLSLLASVALIKHAQVTFTNDSAPLHFASAVNAPVVGIFCSTVPEFGFGPLSERSVVVETSHDLDCRPCGLHGKKACPEGHFKCASIEIEEILAKVDQVMSIQRTNRADNTEFQE